MVAKDVTKKCQEWLAESERLWAAGALTSALFHLAEIHHALTKLPDSERYRWSEIIAQKRPPDIVIGLVRAEVAVQSDSLHELIGRGSQLAGEEMLCVLGMRYELFLLTQLFDYAYGVSLELNMEEIDAEIMRKCKGPTLSPAGRRLFHRLYLS